MAITQKDIDRGGKIARALACFAYNTEHDEFAEAVYHRKRDDYTLEKFRAMQDDLTHYIGSLGDAYLEAFVKAALERAERVG